MRGRISIACVLALLAAAPARALPVPELTGPVVDRAGLLERTEIAELERLARDARARQGGQGVQLQLLIVPSLEGETIEELSMRVAEAWKIGSRGKDNGILVTVARDDRKVRIEVGGGLEGALTDAQAGRIIRETMAPAFRAGRYGEGIREAAVQILRAVESPAGEAEPPSPAPRASSISALGSVSLAVVVTVVEILVVALAMSSILLLVLLPVAIVRSRNGTLGRGGRRRRGNDWNWGSSWSSGDSWGSGGSAGGGWGSGGSSSGGSWSGGGGGFSGGGASGGW